MEQHPVPQNISSFQFKLIGDITLKQFAYVAGGVILAYVSFKITFIPGILRYPFSIFLAILGFGLAFVPIEQRPLDRWLIAFFKSVYMPTQYIWKKGNSIPEIFKQPVMQTVPATPEPKPETPTTVQPVSPPPEPVKKPEPVEEKPIADIPIPPPVLPVIPKTPTPFTPKKADWQQGAPHGKRSTVTVIPAPHKPVSGNRIVFEEKMEPQRHPETSPAEGPRHNRPEPSPGEGSSQSKKSPPANAGSLEKLTSSYQALEKKLRDQMNTMQQEMQKGSVTKERFTELQQLLSQLLTEKDRMSKELTMLRRQLDEKNKPAPVKPKPYFNNQDTTTSVKIVPPQQATHVGVPQLTTYPNVITGIIKDSQGMLLPAIIVSVKDKEGLPVRALKTNKIGQFAASTPLPNGTYVIEVEDPKKSYQFERIEITLTNQVLPPIEISAISQKDVMRQKLAQEIFGKNTL